MDDDGNVVVQVRLPAGLVAEVDGVAGDRGRPTFVRLALRAFLDHMKAPMVVQVDEAALEAEVRKGPDRVIAAGPDRPAVVRAEPAAKPEGLSSRGQVVLAVVKDRGTVTLNEVVRHLGWAPRGVDLAVEELRKAGLVRVDGAVVGVVK